MKKGAPIEIREIHSGVMITPARSCADPRGIQPDKEMIAFQSAEEFIKWLESHFTIYEQPTWGERRANCERKS